MKAYFLLIILIGYFCVFLVVDIIFIINIKKVITLVISILYQKKLKKILKKLEKIITKTKY